MKDYRWNNENSHKSDYDDRYRRLKDNDKKESSRWYDSNLSNQEGYVEHIENLYEEKNSRVGSDIFEDSRTRSIDYQNLKDTVNSYTHKSIAAGAEAGSRSSYILYEGGKSAIAGSEKIIRRTASSTLSEMNKYTPDIYDVGQSGDLTSDGAMFVLGNSAMLAQNSVRMARIPLKKTVDAANQILYNAKRMTEQKLKCEEILKQHPNTRAKYIEIITGQSQKDIVHFSDRMAWNRFSDNEMADFSLRKKFDLSLDKMKSNKYARMVKRSRKLEAASKRLDREKLSFSRSTFGMLKNQSRKISNQITLGNDPSSTTNRTFYMAQKGVRTSTHLAGTVYRKRAVFEKMMKSATHPIRTIRMLANRIVSLISTICSIVSSIPVIASFLAMISPIILAIMCVVMLITSLFGSASYQSNFYNINIGSAATTEYAANAFIYEAKKRSWKENAIIGALAYILTEGGGMGTFSYESYWCVEGPGGVKNDTLTDNKKWLNWIDTKARPIMATQSSYAGRDTVAFGIGLLGDSDVWTNGLKTTSSATRLINYADKKGKPWQDPETQMSWVFDVRFSEPYAFDTKGVDPKKDNRSPDEWCRRVTAGIGMPAWSWQTQNKYMLAHVAKVADASKFVKNYKSFDYVSLASGDLSGSPDFSNSKIWREMNPYTLIGQCTWFAWGRFYEIYGFDPGFRGDGRSCAEQLIAAHPDKFKFSTMPKPGAVFSYNNHVGIVVAVNGNTLTIQDGNVNNLDAIYNFTPHPWELAIKDWRTATFNIGAFNSRGVKYAIPI